MSSDRNGHLDELKIDQRIVEIIMNIILKNEAKGGPSVNNFAVSFDQMRLSVFIGSFS